VRLFIFDFIVNCFCQTIYYILLIEIYIVYVSFPISKKGITQKLLRVGESEMQILFLAVCGPEFMNF